MLKALRQMVLKLLKENVVIYRPTDIYKPIYPNVFEGWGVGGGVEACLEQHCFAITDQIEEINTITT